MEVLTGDTLAEALLFCSQQENVSVCVVLDNMRNTKELVEILWREIELGNLPGWVMQRGFDVASFSNTYSILNTKKSSAMYFITAYDTQNFKGRKPWAYVDSFGDSGINLKAAFWLADPVNGSVGIKTAITLDIVRRFREEGIRIPYNRLEVVMLDPHADDDAPADVQPKGSSAAV